MGLCTYDMRSFAFYQEVTDNLFFQPSSHEASQVSLEFARLGLPGYPRLFFARMTVLPQSLQGSTV